MGNDNSKALEESKEEERAQYEIWTVGDNKYGQQLNGTFDTILKLQQIQNIKQKKVNAIHTMFGGATFMMYVDGEVAVGGCNECGQLGINNEDTHVAARIQHLDFKVNVISKGIDSKHVFVIRKDDNTLYSVGWNEHKQCGVETGSESRDKHNQLEWAPVPLPNVVIKSIATGRTFTIFLSTNGTLLSCGHAGNGALGMGSSMKHHSIPTPTVIPTQTKMIQIAVGEYHCVAISDTQTAFSWGYNGHGRAGHGEHNHSIFKPERIEALTIPAMKQVDCGHAHTLLVGSDGSLFATGKNDEGQCGDGTTAHVFEPKQICVGDNESVQSVKCGAWHNVLTTTKNKIYLWGSGDCGQCLTYGVKDRLIPTLYHMSRSQVHMYAHRKVRVIPGYRETRIIVSPTEVTEFLWSLGFGTYVEAFKDNEFETMDQLKQITAHEWKEIGVATADRHQIKSAMKAHFKKKEDAKQGIVSNDDDGKEEKTHDGDNQDDTKALKITAGCGTSCGQ